MTSASFSASRTSRPQGIALIAWVVACMCLLPMVAVALAAVLGGTDTVAHLLDTVLGRYAGNTALLVVLVAAGTFAVGVGAAWLVTMTRFPAVRVLEIALVLPLALPAACPARHCRRCSAGRDGDHRGFRNGCIFWGADLCHRDLDQLVLAGGSRRGSAAGAVSAVLCAAFCRAGADPTRQCALP